MSIRMGIWKFCVRCRVLSGHPLHLVGQWRAHRQKCRCYPRHAAKSGCATKIHRAIIDAGMIRRDLVEWRMMRRAILTIGAMVLAVAVCNARQLAPAKPAPVQHQPGIPSVDRTPVSAPTLDALIAQVARQIIQKHLKSVVVIGAAGPMPDEPTQFGSEFGDKVSAALAKQSNELRVEDRAELRALVEKNGVSNAMVVSDALANWVASKAGVEGYMLVEFTRVASGGAEILVTLYRTDKEDGYFLSSANTTMDLTLEQYTAGLRPIDSDWNKETYGREEFRQMPAGRKPTCEWCPRPEYTEAARKERYQEKVIMDVTVFPDGKPGDIAVIKSARYGLTADSVESILRTWKFKPALDADGKPMAVRVPVEVYFQLY
jgi:TonB family protein